MISLIFQIIRLFASMSYHDPGKFADLSLPPFWLFCIVSDEADNHYPNPFTFEGLHCLAALWLFTELFGLLKAHTLPAKKPCWEEEQSEMLLSWLVLIESWCLTHRLCAWWDSHFILLLDGCEVELEGGFIAPYLDWALHTIVTQHAEQDSYEETHNIEETHPNIEDLCPFIHSFLEDKPDVKKVFHELISKTQFKKTPGIFHWSDSLSVMMSVEQQVRQGGNSKEVDFASIDGLNMIDGKLKTWESQVAMLWEQGWKHWDTT